MPPHMFAYKARIVGFGPRNFLTADIDLGFGLSTTQTLRIDGVSEYDEAGPWMAKNVLGSDVTVRTVKTDLGYGADVFFAHNGQETSLSDELLRRRLAALFVE